MKPLPLCQPVHAARLFISKIKQYRQIIRLVAAILATLFSFTLSHAVDLPEKATAGQRLKTIIVDNYHPYTFINDKGEPDGFSVEIARAVAKAMDLELEIRADKWDQAMKELEAGSIDLLPMMAYSPERDKLFDFSVPHTIAYDTIFLKKGNSGLRSLKDLSGKTVIVMKGDAAHSYLLSSGLSKTVSLNLVDSLPEALKQLAAGRGDAAIMPKLVGIVTVKKLNLSDIETSPQLIDAYTRPFSFAVKDDNHALLERLNQGLNIIKSSGEYDAIYKKWFGALEDPHIELKTAIKYGSIAALALIVCIVWNIVLKRQVKAKTEHLVTEIAERKQAEDELFESRALLNSIINGTSDAIYVKDPQGRYILFNAAAEKFTGKSAEEALGNDDKALFSSAEALAVMEKDRKMMEGGVVTTYEDELTDATGRKVTFLSTKGPLSDASGKVIGLFGISRDITDRKQAEDKLKEIAEDLKDSQRIAHVGSWRLEFASDEVVWSEELYKMYGFDPKLPPPPLTESQKLFTPESWERLSAAIQDTKSTGISYNLELEMLRVNGRPGWMWAYGMPVLDTNGITVGVRGVAQDITDRKRNEEEKQAFEHQLHQAQKMESLGVLAGGIAHDFNNILAVIICNCSLAMQRPKMAEKLIPEIETAAQRAAGLCRQMLAYAGKTQFVESSVDVTALVDDMLSMLKSTLPQNVTIKPYLSGDMPHITGDASQIRQIVMNLIINASEAIGEEHGVIVVSLTRKQLVESQPEKDHLGNSIPTGHYLCLEVTDTGCGMDDQTKQRLFEPFFTTKFTGRGLGMSAVLGIVTSHKGALQLYSQPGQGTSFKVYLPVQIDITTGDKSLPQLSLLPWQGSGTILLVEDEPQLVAVAKALLETLGFSVIEASNGIEAIEKYRNNAAEIRLVVTDIGMPQMGGYELIAELNKLNPELPVIVSSGFGDADVTSKITPGVIAGLISKPYNFDQLREVLKGVVDKTVPKQEA